MAKQNIYWAMTPTDGFTKITQKEYEAHRKIGVSHWTNERDGVTNHFVGRMAIKFLNRT